MIQLLLGATNYKEKKNEIFHQIILNVAKMGRMSFILSRQTIRIDFEDFICNTFDRNQPEIIKRRLKNNINHS